MYDESLHPALYILGRRMTTETDTIFTSETLVEDNFGEANSKEKVPIKVTVAEVPRSLSKIDICICSFYKEVMLCTHGRLYKYILKNSISLLRAVSL